jgi:CBS domain containing-hemolysin-like protein
MNYCVRDTYTIKELAEQFETNHERAAIVINENKKVIGIVSQGDIIRALSKGIDIYAHIKTIISPSFLYLVEKNMDSAYKMFKQTQITLLPVVNDDFEIRDVITIKDIYKYLEDRSS